MKKETKKTILLIEDDRIIRDIFSEYLRGNYDVLTAENGQAAMDILDKKVCSLIILDIFLRGPNGFAFLHELRSYDDLLSIPVIVCTSEVQHLQSSDLEKYGVRALLDKTKLTPPQLFDVVASLL